MKQIKTLLAALFVAMAGTASAQTTNWVHIFKNNGSAAHYSQTEIQLMTIDTEEPYVEFTSGGNTVKVAKMNLGATSVADGTSCYGDYYAWGATETFGTVDQSTGTVTPTTGHDGGYSQANAPYWNGSAYTKYTGTSDATLEAADDAVAANMPGWHMPTQAEIQTLYAACGGSGSTPTGTISSNQEAYPSTAGIYWVTGGNAAVKIDDDTYSVNGLLFVQDADHHVFFPAAGRVGGTDLNNAGNIGYSWSSSLNTGYTYRLYFYSNYVRPDSSHYRYYGYPVRPFKD